jgi:outer membrane protein
MTSMNKGLIICAVALFAGTVSAVAQESSGWTLKKCIEYAMANNISLKKSGLTKESSIEDWKQAKANLLPSLSASTSHSLGYRPWVNDGVSTVNNGTVSTSVNKTYYNGSYSLSANWTVWNGNKNRNNVKLGELNERIAELDSAATANTIQEQIVQLYVQILYTTEAVKVNKESYDISVQNEKRGKDMVAVGKMSKADLARLTAQTAQDQYSIVEAESNLQKYKTQLKQLLEITGDETFDVVVPEASDEQALASLPTLQSVYESALATRPEIENSKLAIKSGELNIAIAKAERMPTIGINGGVMTSNTSMNDKSWGKQIKTNFDASVGATLSIPIFDNRSARTAINKAKIQQAQNMLDLTDKQKTLYSTIEGYWIDANTNQQKFKAAKANVESAQASFDLLNEQFSLGLKNITELMEGKTSLLTAQQNMLQSKYMAILDQQLLNFYEGKAMDL